MMSREDMQFRDRLLFLAERSNPHRPSNVKRRAPPSAPVMPSSAASSRSSVKTHNRPKLSVQDFVRMDPGYTPDIEHLVFPGGSRRRSPQQVAPLDPQPSAASKTRSRLAEMFALSRHLQMRSADREHPRNQQLKSGHATNRSVDSVLSGASASAGAAAAASGPPPPPAGSRTTDVGARRWAEEPVRQNSGAAASRVSPAAESADMAAARGPNVSVLHLRSPSEPPWETTYNSRTYISKPPHLTKHQSLGAPSSGSYKWTKSPNFHHSTNGGSSNKKTSPDFFVVGSTAGTSNKISCNRELSPVRWCDREVDGVYLGRSGWVQVQQRSLDENRRVDSYASVTNHQQRRKFADYHCNSEPGKYHSNEFEISIRPSHLSLDRRNSPSPPPRHPSPMPDESFSPPTSITPIISPPPAFQDRNRKKFFSGGSGSLAKKPFLPRSPAIVDSDVSPPLSPPVVKWKSSSMPGYNRKTSPVHTSPKKRIPQTKSLEDTTTSRRLQFTQRYGESSSSSSSSMGFRSFDNSVNQRPIMPRLSENTDSSIYEDADEEDNNSSSLNLSTVSSTTSTIKASTPSTIRERVSPSGRTNRFVNRKSPAGSDNNNNNNHNSATSPGSSSSSSNEYPSPHNRRTRPKMQQQQQKQQQQDDQKVRRSRSLQLPERSQTRDRISPQYTPGDARKRGSPVNKDRTVFTEEDMLREAEVVTSFLYGNRTKAAAQSLLKHRYYNNEGSDQEDEDKKYAGPNSELTVYLVNPKKDNKQKTSGSSGSTLPNCSQESCDFWPHCAHHHRTSQTMRSSQSYPTHKSLDLPSSSGSSGSNRKTNARKYVSPRLSPGDRTVDRSVGGFNSAGGVFCDNISSGNGGNVLLLGSGEKMILTRPGSAPEDAVKDERISRGEMLEQQQQRSMSLPKSFLSINSGGQQQGGHPPTWRRGGTESLGSSPGLPRKGNPETSHTAPVTPLHEGNRRRSPLGTAVRRTKANSTPHLSEAQSIIDSRNKWIENKATDPSECRLNPTKEQQQHKQLGSRRNLPSTGNTATAESVLQKFKKSFSLRFHQKNKSKDGGGSSSDLGETLSEILGDPSEEDSPQHVPSSSVPSASSSNTQIDVAKDEKIEQKSRFGPLIWRSSKERKKLNKAARSAKCNSGDSGIQIEMAPGCGGGDGDSSESHDTDPPGDNLDSPPSVRRRSPQGNKSTSTRPHSDLLNQILIDKFKSDLKQRAPHRHSPVRRTRSDLGGRRLLNWDGRSSSSSHRRPMSAAPSPAASLPGRPQSPRKRPPDAPGGVRLRMQQHYGRGQLRRSLSQPLDIDKLSPLMRTKTAGLRPSGSHVPSEDEHDGRPLAHTSDDDAMSDSESSVASLTDRKKSLETAMDEDVVILAEAVFDHVAIEADELAFSAGDVVEVLETVNRDWWWGCTGGRCGWFPAQFVRLRVGQEDTVEDCLAAMASGRPASAQVRRRTSISLLSNDQVRTSVVRELVHTERDFVKVLQDVVEGYMAECRKRTDMFTPQQIATIFINLEEILRFQASFLRDLESRIDWDSPHRSCIGACFLQHKAGFKMYSEYCNGHPMATASLQELYRLHNYGKFFEACRLMRGLIEIPLDGYLLTPVQRICKYPLQLAELLKYTRREHGDYADVGEALEAMRDVAVLINERKRRMESLEKLAAWQQRVEAWEGEDLIEVSSQLIHQGEVVRVTTGVWTNSITLFLFDHQILYCKKDILKRHTYVYKGRICLDTSEVIDVPNGKDAHSGVSVRHAIKIYSCVRDKWLLFCCRSSNDKQRWLHAFSEERRLVVRDKDEGLEFPQSARQLAKVAARCQRRPPRKPRNGKNYNKQHSYTGSVLQLNSSMTNHGNSLGTKMGTWFTFNKKSRHRDVS